MSTYSKLEGQIVVPTGGWTFAYTENSGSSIDVTVTAGNYYLSSATALLSSIGTSMTSASVLGETYSLTLADATGKVTITGTTVGGLSDLGITWTSTDLRNLLGFTGNLTGAVTYTGSNQATHLWLPGVYREATNLAPDGYSGAYETDTVINMAPDGTLVSTQYRTRQRDVLSYRYLKGSNVWTSLEVTTNESLETFWTSVLAAGRPFRYHKDRSDDATFVTWRAMDAYNFQPTATEQGFTSGANSLWAWGSEVRKNV